MPSTTGVPTVHGGHIGVLCSVQNHQLPSAHSRRAAAPHRPAQPPRLKRYAHSFSLAFGPVQTRKDEAPIQNPPVIHRLCIIARPVSPSNENKRVFFVFFCLFCRFGPVWAVFQFFWCFFWVFGFFHRYIHFPFVVAHHCNFFFPPKVYVVPYLQQKLSRRVSVSCKHHCIQTRNNGTGVHIERIDKEQYT